ncbi:U1 snRNP-associated protein usp107 [Sphaceloma murrayae]|uniref:U1 snRNP-associated protein usp107 n=1 Tax=Sphaceloma murrayae TaxID=2082308 RepID=A0A2K1QYL0_9PEZI|nr:U1 snRNP-associated protein usp107 [Sphaceloma murrayae]
MAFNYGAPPAMYGAPPGYGNYAGAPGMGPPPNTGGAPGMSPPPGVHSSQGPTQPGSGFPDLANMALPSNINFSAPVIRMGGTPGRGGKLGGFDYGGRDAGGGNRGRSGLGMDMGSRQSRDTNIQPLTKEEVSRTIYIGGLVEGTPDEESMERILGATGGLHRWSRVRDADGKALDFGFAEYDDAASLEMATIVLKDLEVPLKSAGSVEKDDDGNVRKAKLIMIVDPASEDYISTWTKHDDEKKWEFDIMAAREDLTTAINNHANSVASNGDNGFDASRDNGETAELIAMPQSADDDLSDIPADMREMVAEEIAAFRDRSNKRDLERLRMEGEVEKLERERSRANTYAAQRINRLASPPPTAPRGPGATNGFVSGGVQSHVPTGPKHSAPRIPKDHTYPLTESAKTEQISNGDDADSASDTEVERRHQSARDAEVEKEYLERERRWAAKEKAHFAAVERQQKEEAHEAANRESRRAALAAKLEAFDDSDPSTRASLHPFYTDRRAWLKDRRIFRSDEKRADDKDRKAEARELEAQRRKDEQARGVADRFLDETAQEVSRKARAAQEKSAFSLNLGFGKREDLDEDEEKKPRATMLEMENLLGDVEDEAAQEVNMTLKEMEFKPLADGEMMSEEERAKARTELARGIPNDRQALFAWEVKWEHLPDEVVGRELRPYVEKKIMESLGVQEELLVTAVEGVIRRHGKAEEVVRELEETLDEEAEMVARRVWRMVVFFSESGARGLLG